MKKTKTNWMPLVIGFVTGWVISSAFTIQGKPWWIWWFYAQPLIALTDWYLFTQLFKEPVTYAKVGKRFYKIESHKWKWLMPCFLESAMLLIGIAIGMNVI